MESPITSLPRPPRCVLFDLDGTLIDSIPLFMRVAAEMFDQAGLPRPRPESLVTWLKQGEPGWEGLIPEHMLADREKIAARLMEIGRRVSARLFSRELALLPGVKRVFTLLAGRSIPIAVVTTGSARFIGRKMEPFKRRGLDRFIERLITREDAPRVKPAPDPLLICCGLMEMEPRQCLYVGDADVDIQAGRAAGMMTAAVLTGIDDRATLRDQEPDLLLEGLPELASLL